MEIGDPLKIIEVEPIDIPEKAPVEPSPEPTPEKVPA